MGRRILNSWIMCLCACLLLASTAGAAEPSAGTDLLPRAERRQIGVEHAGSLYENVSMSFRVRRVDSDAVGVLKFSCGGGFLRIVPAVL